MTVGHNNLAQDTQGGRDVSQAPALLQVKDLSVKFKTEDWDVTAV